MLRETIFNLEILRSKAFFSQENSDAFYGYELS